MRVQVNMDRCQHYGQCVFEAPSNFALNDEDLLEYVAEVDDANLEEVRSAVAVCPVQAITLRS
ncbi:ferredoxin [Agromyces mediolanus]|uniref:ferredoxin n=1 Tax=Agromyces mediolanus TaxID=41986 RepID=UPI00203D0B3C|nr:ferredoxin [Agromyces mediolanus]MCM3658370.1 ferredoxin [Agromyces mediolanus]